MILTLALANCLGGRSPLSRGRILFRGLCFGIPAGIYAFIFGHSPLISLAVFAWVSVAAWATATFPTAEGFMVITGHDVRDEKRHPRWIKLVNWLTRSGPEELTGNAAKKWGLVAMTVRGAAQYPLYAGLAVLNPWALVIGLLCPLHGVCYWMGGKTGDEFHAVARAELFSGALTGALLLACLGG